MYKFAEEFRFIGKFELNNLSYYLVFENEKGYSYTEVYNKNILNFKGFNPLENVIG